MPRLPKIIPPINATFDQLFQSVEENRKNNITKLQEKNKLKKLKKENKDKRND